MILQKIFLSASISPIALLCILLDAIDLLIILTLKLLFCSKTFAFKMKVSSKIVLLLPISFS